MSFKDLKSSSPPPIHRHHRILLQTVSCLLIESNPDQTGSIQQFLLNDLSRVLNSSVHLEWSPGDSPLFGIGLENEAPIPIQNLGEGFVRLLVFGSLRWFSEHPLPESLLILIDLPEGYIHEGVQKRLMQTFHRLSKRNHQVVIATHSPYFSQSPHLDRRLVVHRKSGDLVLTTMDKPACFMLPVDY